MAWTTHQAQTSCTILLLDLPQTALVGIDLLCFNSSPPFRGITVLPLGWHFLFTGASASLSIRYGLWFHVTAEDARKGVAYVWKWDAHREELAAVSNPVDLHRWREQFHAGDESLLRGLFPYRQTSLLVEDGDAVEESLDWPQMTSKVTAPVLARLTHSPSPARWSLTSASCGKEDRDDIPGLGGQDMAEGVFGGEERELVFLGINLRQTWREGAVGRERTVGARDRSWALGDIVRRHTESTAEESGKEDWGSAVLGEMQVCFLMILTLSNHSCMEEWKRIIGLVLVCRDAVLEHERFFVDFVALLRLQIRHCHDVEGGLFDLTDDAAPYLQNLLKTFKRNLVDLSSHQAGQGVHDEMQKLEDWFQQEYHWDLSDLYVRKGMLELEDGEQVEMEMEDLDGEDEKGEYAPVIVTMD